MLRELGGGAKFSRRRATGSRSSGANLDAEREPANGRGNTTDIADQSADIGHAGHNQSVGTKFAGTKPVADAEQHATTRYADDYPERRRARQPGKSELDDGSLSHADRDTDNAERIESGGHIEFQQPRFDQPWFFAEFIGTRQQHGKHDDGDAGHSAHYAVGNAVQTGNTANWRLNTALEINGFRLLIARVVQPRALLCRCCGHRRAFSPAENTSLQSARR